ncbi:MAG: protease inhibitor I42 family protein [Actinomycetota bacterium]|nr:protease inhibitor I42 family protein [Actinomycetota bacterium]
MTQNRSVRSAAIAAAFVVSLTALVAMAPVASAKNNLLNVPGKTTLAVGQSADVRLATNPSTGYHWVTTITGDQSAIKLTKGVYKTLGQVGLPGAGGVTVWTITGKAGGKAKITFGTVPPGGTAAQYEVALTVTVH